MEVIINTSPISYVGNNAVMTFVLSGALSRSETIGINLIENSIGPFVQSRHYRKAVIAMLWSKITHRITTLTDVG